MKKIKKLFIIFFPVIVCVLLINTVFALGINDFTASSTNNVSKF